MAGAPPLAVEYADTGQDDAELATRIAELFDAGTKIIWMVRLGGPRRVEVHEAGHEVRTAHQGEELTALGILRNPVPVAAPFDREAAHAVILRNLLQRQGYNDLDAVRTEALRASVVDVLEARDLALDGAARATLDACRDVETLRHWLGRAATVSSSDEVFSS